MKPMGIYLHVPFCLSKCPYCDFYSLPLDQSLADAYLSALLRGLERCPWRGRPADTLYLGGGTPSLLGHKRLLALLEAVNRAFPLAQGAEITLEANPGTVELPLLKELRAGGFNRLSMGMQSALPHELRLLGRGHTPGQAARAVKQARSGGFDNLSLDLMLGIPGQSLPSALESAGACARLEAVHISAYMLKVEPGTPFGRSHMEDRVMDGDTLAGLYLALCQRLEGLGYNQYEISNFARPGRESRHNLKYWKGGEYLGLGPSAHSMLEGRRFFFPRDLEGFIAAPDVWPLAVPDGEGGTREEFVMLRLRLTEGLSLAELERRWPGENVALRSRLPALEEAGYARCAGGRLGLTPKGFLVSNAVIARLLEQ